MATIIKKNYKSDFDAILHLKSCVGDVCKNIGWPDYDWVARFYTTSHDNVYIASNIGGVLTNCFNDNGNIHVVFNNHGLPSGTLRVEFSAEIPNDIYPDGSQLEVSPQALDIELVRGVGDCGTIADVEVMLSFIKGDKGDPFTYEDLTEEQIAELQKPATEAAESVSKLEEEVSRAEALRASAEQTREANEQSRISAENGRISDENERTANETARQDNEATRTDNEAERQENEESRVSAETARSEEFATWQGEIDGKQNALTTSEDLSISTSNELSLTERAKQRLFDDMWLKAVGSYGSIDHTHKEDGVSKPYYLNELWFTYDEAVAVYVSWHKGVHQNEAMSKFAVRTNMPFHTEWDSLMDRYAQANKTVEVLHLPMVLIGNHCFNAFYNCTNLRKVYGLSHLHTNIDSSIFYGCSKLEYVGITNLKSSLNLMCSPLLCAESLRFIVTKAANTSAITITVHADVYAKLTGDTTNEAAAALTPEELAQWQQVLTDAAAKNIIFATA